MLQVALPIVAAESGCGLQAAAGDGVTVLGGVPGRGRVGGGAPPPSARGSGTCGHLGCARGALRTDGRCGGCAAATGGAGATCSLAGVLGATDGSMRGPVAALINRWGRHLPGAHRRCPHPHTHTFFVPRSPSLALPRDFVSSARPVSPVKVGGRGAQGAGRGTADTRQPPGAQGRCPREPRGKFSSSCWVSSVSRLT